MNRQQKIDALTEQVLSNTAGVKEAIANEAAEIKAAIENSNVDTTQLEAALAQNAGLAKLVNDMYTDAGEVAPIPVPEPSETPREDAPTGETPADETAADEAVTGETAADETSTGEDAAARNDSEEDETGVS